MPADTTERTGMLKQVASTSSPRGLQLALATAVISGIAVYINGQAVSRFASPTVYTTGKNLVAGVFLVALAIASRATRRPADTRQHRTLRPREIVVLCAVAAFGGGAAFVLFFEGLSAASSTDAAFLHKTLVIWAAVIAVVVLKERVGVVQVGAIALLIAGHVVLASGVGSLRLGSGELMILAATLLWSGEVVAVRWLLGSIQPATLAGIRVGGGAVLLVGWLVVSGDVGRLIELGASQLGWLLLTGALLTCFVSCWYRALAQATVVDVTAVLVLGAVITGWLDVVIGHSPAASRTPGWVLLAAGVALLVTYQLVTLTLRQPRRDRLVT